MDNCLNFLVISDSVSSDQSALNSYPVLIRNYLKATKSKSVVYINRAVSGLTSTRMKDAENFCANYDADIAIIAIGVNDALSAYSSTFTTNVQAIITKLKLRNPDIEIILCCLTRTTTAARITNSPDYNTAIAALAVANDCSICHFENAWIQDNAAASTSDGIHPTEAAHVLLYNLLTPIIDTILG